jgi:hypothetical protein
LNAGHSPRQLDGMISRFRSNQLHELASDLLPLVHQQIDLAVLENAVTNLVERGLLL